MCPARGKPYYIKKVNTRYEKCYEIPDITVPDKICDYLEGRGHLFHAYTDYFNEQDIFNVSVDEFLEHYPSWEDVQKHDYFRDDIVGYWSEKDHDWFKLLLEWCVKQEVSFRVMWSY